MWGETCWNATHCVIQMLSTYPLSTPSTRFSIKNEPSTMRGTKYTQLYVEPTASSVYIGNNGAELKLVIRGGGLFKKHMCSVELEHIYYALYSTLTHPLDRLDKYTCIEYKWHVHSLSLWFLLFGSLILTQYSIDVQPSIVIH